MKTQSNTIFKSWLSIALALCFLVITSCNTSEEVMPSQLEVESLANKSNSQYPSFTWTHSTNLNTTGLNLNLLGVHPSRVAAYQTNTYLIGNTQYAADMLITNEQNGVSEVIIFEPNSQDIYTRITLEDDLNGVKRLTYATAKGDVYMRGLWNGSTVQITEINEELQELQNKSFTSRFGDCVWGTVRKIATDPVWFGVISVGLYNGAAHAIVAGLAVGCTIRAIRSK